MKDFKIVPMNLETDKPQIAKWQQDFAGKPEFDGILHFILEDNTYFGLDEVITTNYEIFPIGEDETKHALVAKTRDGEIVGFVICSVFGLTTKEPEMFLQYIVVNPAFQNKGYGTAILSKLLTEPKKYVGAKPVNIFSYIHNNNFASKNLYDSIGFEFAPQKNSDYIKATGSQPVIEKCINSLHGLKK